MAGQQKLIAQFTLGIIIPLLFTGAYALDNPPSPKISIEDTRIDYNFLKKMEGSKLKGYVPLGYQSKSGVTIANGFDFGQLDLLEFNKLPLDESLKDKLRPYVGLKQQQAQAFLEQNPLVITQEEFHQLNKVAANKILLPLMKTYDRFSRTPFMELPSEAQTVIFSYAYHNGPGFMRKNQSKQLWKHFVSQEWTKASHTLKKFKLYSHRRIHEAKLLDRLA